MSSKGELLRTAREKHGKSQGDVALFLGIWPNTVSRWELGSMAPRGKNWRRLGELFPELAVADGLRSQTPPV
jgi:transcriptional regulator with XRE-family HTH domain